MRAAEILCRCNLYVFWYVEWNAESFLASGFRFHTKSCSKRPKYERKNGKDFDAAVSSVNPGFTGLGPLMISKKRVQQPFARGPSRKHMNCRTVGWSCGSVLSSVKLSSFDGCHDSCMRVATKT